MEKLQLSYAASGGTDWHDHSGTLVISTKAKSASPFLTDTPNRNAQIHSPKETFARMFIGIVLIRVKN